MHRRVHGIYSGKNAKNDVDLEKDLAYKAPNRHRTWKDKLKADGQTHRETHRHIQKYKEEASTGNPPPLTITCYQFEEIARVIKLKTDINNTVLY